MSIDWGKIITAAVPAVVSAGAGLLAQSDREDKAQAQLDQEAALAREDTYLQLRLAALKAQYAGGSGGGGGGGAAGPDPNFISKADHVAAVAGQGDAEQSAINNLITAIQNGYSLAARG